MDRYQYFIQSMKDKAHYKREWMLRAMSVVIDDVKIVNGDYPKWSLRHTEDRVEVYVPTEEGLRWEVLEDAIPYEIPFIYHEMTGPVKVGDVENVKKDIEETTWGDLIFNSRALVYACGDIIPYMEGPVSLKKISQHFAKTMKDEVPDAEKEPGQLYISNWLRLGKAIGDLAGYEMFVPSITEKSITPPDNRDELRNSLIEKYKDQLDDPVIQSKIQNEMVASYKERIKGDPSEGFIYKTKSINTALKRMVLIHGPEAGFNEGGRATLILNSLQEGIDVTKYPDMVNSLRAGSYYRGALTALAGEDVDLMGRIFQNARILPGFCGTTETFEWVIDKRRIGRTIFDEGEKVTLSEENIERYEGKVYGIYSPLYCKAARGDICTVCAGEKIAAYPESIGSMVGEIPSKMMAIMMASAHAKELKTTPLDVENFLR